MSEVSRCEAELSVIADRLSIGMAEPSGVKRIEPLDEHFYGPDTEYCEADLMDGSVVYMPRWFDADAWQRAKHRRRL